ncbi:hypothetical protein Tco_1232107 [Tanacetum coccineum]
MVKTSNGDTPFSFTYGTEVVILVEIGMPSLRCAEVNQAENDDGLLLKLDILEERREKATVREAKSKAKMERYYNAKVRNTTFRPGDFVYRINEASHIKESVKVYVNYDPVVLKDAPCQAFKNQERHRLKGESSPSQRLKGESSPSPLLVSTRRNQQHLGRAFT